MTTPRSAGPPADPPFPLPPFFPSSSICVEQLNIYWATTPIRQILWTIISTMLTTDSRTLTIYLAEYKIKIKHISPTINTNKGISQDQKTIQINMLLLYDYLDN